MNDTKRKRHLTTLFIVSMSMGVIIGSLATPFVNPIHIVSTAAVVIGVTTIVSPPYTEVYNDE